MSRGISGDLLDGSFRNRESRSYVNGVGDGLVRVVESTPQVSDVHETLSSRVVVAGCSSLLRFLSADELVHRQVEDEV